MVAEALKTIGPTIKFLVDDTEARQPSRQQQKGTDYLIVRKEEKGVTKYPIVST